MASLLTAFDITKYDLLANARQYGVCEGYHELMRATDYQMLIDAAIPLLVYGYRSGILTDAILAGVDEALLNENGIYTTNAVITNPLTEIFVLKNAVVGITVDNGERHNVNVMGTGIATIIISGNSFCTIKTYQQGFADVTLNDTSAACIETMQSSIANVVANNDATGDIASNGDSQLNLTFNDTSYALVQGFGQSLINTAGAGTYNIRLYENSKIPVIGI
jgi:hypothetical protein